MNGQSLIKVVGYFPQEEDLWYVPYAEPIKVQKQPMLEIWEVSSIEGAERCLEALKDATERRVISGGKIYTEEEWNAHLSN